MSAYLSLAQSAEIELLILNSRFIARACEVQSVAEAEAFLQSCKSRYPDATHHCYAFELIGPPVLARFSDDGEPAGTAGRPIYTVLSHQASNAMVVVIRYFGGTRLGKGGLVKAYTEASKQVIASAGLKQQETLLDLQLSYPYHLSGSLAYFFQQQALQAELHYGEQVSARVAVPQSQLDAVSQSLSHWVGQGLSWNSLPSDL